jgi:signal transduction histidine kinase
MTTMEGGYAVIRVSDTGTGISPEQLRSLFDPGFVKTESRVKAGLGMFTSYNIIMNHHGDIQVDSVQGEGTTVTITLPVGGME